MTLTKEKKESIVEDLKKRIEGAGILLFVNFHGLSVGAVQQLRTNLRQKGVGYRVAKKTLLQRALGDDKKVDPALLEGEVGVVFGYDNPLEATKEVWQFHKENEKDFKILAALFEGKIFDAQMVEQLANIPSHDVLLGQLTYVIASPLRSMVGVCQGTIRNLLGVLSNIQK